MPALLIPVSVASRPKLSPSRLSSDAISTARANTNFRERTPRSSRLSVVSSTDRWSDEARLKVNGLRLGLIFGDRGACIAES